MSATRADIADRSFAALAWAAGFSVLAIIGAIIVMLFVGGLPAFQHFGLSFLTIAAWDPPKQVFGALVAVYGTILTSVIALVLAVPLSFGIAFFLTEISPAWLRGPLGTAVELLAGIPSIIYGMWGFFVVVPIMAQHVQPPVIDAFGWLDDRLGDVPVLGWIADRLADLFAGPPYGSGVFTAGVILAVMTIPFIAATMRDVFLTVPNVFKESAYGLGCTTWEVMRSIVLPHTRTAVVGGIMLGLGRALGETMAVTYVIGNTNHLSDNLFANGNTIASLIALDFDSAQLEPLRLHSLLALGFLLFVISFIVLAISRLLLRPRVKV